MYDNYNVSVDPIQTSTVAMMQVLTYNKSIKEANNIFESVMQFFTRIFR